MSTILKNNLKSPFPVLNVSRRSEPVATDTVYSDTPDIDNRSISVQIFAGMEILSAMHRLHQTQPGSSAWQTGPWLCAQRMRGWGNVPPDKSSVL